MRPITFASGLAVVLALVGCRQEKVRIYTIPKEQALAAPPPASPHGEMTRPQVEFKAPAGWEEKAAEGMRVASFQIPNAQGQAAEVSVTPMEGMAGNKLAVVNMWREGVGLPGIADQELEKLAETVPVGEKQGQLYNLAGTNVSITAAVLNEGNTSWYFKMTGPSNLVAAQQAAFREFLASVQLRPGRAMPLATPGAPATTGSGGAGQPSWQVPAGWRETPPSVMALARFVLGEGDRAEVTVTPLGGPAGGLLANVNRWRGQLGLAPVEQGQLDQDLQPLDQAGPGAMLVQMTGNDVRGGGAPATIVAVIVPRSDQTWFYKLKGEPALVNDAKQAFLAFVESVKYPDGI